MKVFLGKLVLLLFVLFISCNTNKEDIIKIKPILAIDRFEDSTFFASSACIRNYKNILFIAEDNRILVTDSNFNLIRTIGRAGRGPGEFVNIYHLVIFKDTIYALSEMTKKIMVFNLEGKYLRNFRIPVIPMGKMAVDSEGKFYASSNVGKNPIICFDSNGKILFTFGKYFNGKKDFEDRKRTISDLYIYNKNLLAINKIEMLLQLYSLQNKKLITEKKLSLNGLKDFTNEIKYQKDIMNKRRNVSVSLISGSYVTGKYLYFTIIERNENGSYINKIIKYNLQSYTLSKIYEIAKGKLPINENWISSFCVKSNYLYVSGGDSKELIKYKL